MSEDALIENQEAEIIDPQIDGLADNLNASKISDIDSTRNDSISGTLNLSMYSYLFTL